MEKDEAHMHAPHSLLHSWRAGAIGLAMALLLVTVTRLAYTLPSQAARSPNPHSKHARPTPAIVATPPPISSDWPMYGDNPGFRVVPKRWIVERAFSWIGRHRRMSKDYERQAGSAEAFIYLVGIRLLLARLTRG
jgi:hypothetical protein